jgi:AcrR family transcriptional regulator
MAAPERIAEPIHFRMLPAQPWERGGTASAAWQRARMFHAIVRAVSEKGYAKVTVADVVGLAGVSRRTFYEHFNDAEDCFVEAYDAATRVILAEVESAVRDAYLEDWHDRFEVAIGAYLGALASDPAVARACLVDTVGAGPRAVDARRHVYAQFAAQMRALRHPGGGKKEGEKIPEVQFWAAVGAIGELVQDHILMHGADSLPVLTPTLTRLGWALLETSFAHDTMPPTPLRAVPRSS